jgi:hypothetical protein
MFQHEHERIIISYDQMVVNIYRFRAPDNRTHMHQYSLTIKGMVRLMNVINHTPNLRLVVALNNHNGQVRKVVVYGRQ